MRVNNDRIVSDTRSAYGDDTLSSDVSQNHLWAARAAEANTLLWSLSTPAERQQLVAEQQFQNLLTSRLKPLAQNQQAFNEVLTDSFGDSFDTKAANDLRVQILNGDTLKLPRIQLVDAAELNGALGAYSGRYDTIFLNREIAGTEIGQQTLLEEFGHAIDGRINKTDSMGDEGELFRRQASGEELSATQLNRIRAEDDTGSVEIGGRSISVEFRTEGGYTGSDYPWNPGGVASGSTTTTTTTSSTGGGYDGPDYPWNAGGAATSSPAPQATPTPTPSSSSPTTTTISSSGGYTGPDYPWNPGGVASGSTNTQSATQTNSVSGGYTGPDYPWNPGGVAVSSPDIVARSAPTSITPVSIRQIEQRTEQLAEKAQTLTDDINALGTSGGYVTDTMRAELLDVLVELEGGDISTAWQVRSFMEEGLSLGEARLRVRDEAATDESSIAVSNDTAVTGLSDEQFGSMVNALIADGMSPDVAADTVLNSAIEHQTERNAIMHDYVANLLNVPNSVAQDIVAFNHNETGSIDGLPADVSDALSRVEIRFINGTDQPFLVGQPGDVEIIGDYFDEEYGSALSAYSLNDGTWATERPLDAHLADSAPFDVHLFLDVLGFVPVIGEAADGLNAVIYLAEGDYVNAGISAAALIPVAGSTATGARVLARSQDMINGLGAVLKGSSKVDGVTVNLLELSDGSIIKVMELEDGQTIVVRGSAEALGESADEIAAAGRIGDGAADTSASSVREISFDSDEVLVGTSTSSMRRNSARQIADDPDHPLRFLLNDSGTGFKPADGTTHFDLINQPDVVQMGHVISKKTGHTEYIVLQTAYENQLLNNSIERTHIGGAVLGFEVVEIGGIGVSKETAELWELLEYLPAGTVANAPRVNIPAPPPGT